MKLKDWWEWVIKRIRCIGCGHKYFPDECYTFGANVDRMCGYCGRVKKAKGLNV